MSCDVLRVYYPADDEFRATLLADGYGHWFPHGAEVIASIHVNTDPDSIRVLAAPGRPALLMCHPDTEARLRADLAAATASEPAGDDLTAARQKREPCPFLAASRGREDEPFSLIDWTPVDAPTLGIALSSAGAGDTVTVDLETPAAAAGRILRDADPS